MKVLQEPSRMRNSEGGGGDAACWPEWGAGSPGPHTRDSESSSLRQAASMALPNIQSQCPAILDLLHSM